MADYAGSTLRLGAMMFLATVVSWTSAEPSCFQIDGHKYRRLICREFESPDDFKKHVPRSESSKDTWFLLIDSAVDRLPPAAFAGLNVSELILSNVTLSSLDGPEDGEGPFSGLEQSLQKMVFRRDSTLPSSWSQLGKMAALRELHLQRYLNLNLTRDFGKLPPGLKVVFVFDSILNKVDDDWLADLNDLETVIVRVTNLPVFARSMLPRPAPKLRTLDLAENNLRAFPRGIGDDLPALQFVNLEDNRITTLDEKDVAPLHRDSVIVRLIGNPIHCDCRLWFLLDYTDRWHYFLCRSPEIHQGRYIKMLSEPELPCEYETPPVLADGVAVVPVPSAAPAADASPPATQATSSESPSSSSSAR
ncbi:uncharacterized protein LOC142581878 [Dermacentor variabilis]|uniref:uncharacterized protein LOC142581878 n=1 Tax=Dermacentor variabilis TaxID=34621 RepID=UPI003F5B5FB5